MDEFALAFSLSNFGPKSFQKILNKFGNAREAWNAPEDDFKELGIGGLTFKKFDKFRKEFNNVQYTVRLRKANVEFISFFDKKYPPNFKKLENPPIGIFCKGNIRLLKDSSRSLRMTDEDVLRIAVVGTRKITSYGRSVVDSIVSDLTQNGVCIISGLALGVDGLSHRVCLENKGLAIAVMPCGVDCCRPSENYSLYRKIIDNNGLIISEYPLSTPPNKGTFLARNRLIAVLSDGVLVTEAAEDSGSLVTADWGFKLNKKVFAVPGPINSQMAQGSLKLLKQGAILVSQAEDILREFSISNSQFSMKSKLKNLKLSKEEKKIVEFLENEELTIDEIIKKINLSASQLFILLSNLELNGIIKSNGSTFSLRNLEQK